MVFGAEVTIEGRVATIDQELEVAELPRAEIDRQPISRTLADLGGTIVIDHEVYQTRSVWADEMIQCSGSPAQFYLRNLRNGTQRGIVTPLPKCV